ncbi:hypothetical protein MRB53_020587 [Persea americana]|uniref:Uncharacterized protein n=1 Tax=Persea americana TaxID=3435 RepID=A0ACC2L1U2_PERAE|nr:hypothetical protein MRB53_020587 [Persea americana]
MLLSLRLSVSPFLSRRTLIFSTASVPFPRNRFFFSSARRNSRNLRSPMSLIKDIQPFVSESAQDSSSFPGIEDALMGFISGKTKATTVAHSVWQNVIHKGDTVVDATCGNGHDTLVLLKFIADDSGKGCVYAMDIQDSALKSTCSLLDRSVGPSERELVKLFSLCHSRMEDVIPKGASVRLVAFNLGYLPGGDKTVITTSKTTLPALQAASRILRSEGLISVMVYVGHPGGREELETVQTFASGLPVETWVCCKFEMLNRPNSPVLILIFKK